ncbi:hypothetical protein BY458DRAFT_497261 [Sporodiniella umbellata]|nr:hypothetical protein BY458DRAFT_497261 [Sporodiniella umbellata]
MSLFSNEQEIPITSAPVYEGHLYIRNEKKQWKWRLFRFDGSNFTCLNSKKYPPNPSVTNPLYISPKRLTDEVMQPPLKHFQLPYWTIDVTSISSISLLRKAKKAPKYFSVQTVFGKRFVFKASKQKDMERWLFVLTKMWKFTQDQQILLYQPPLGDDKPMLSEEKIQVIEEWQRSLAELMAYDPNIKKYPPPIEPIPEDENMSIFTDITSVSHKRTKRAKKLSKRSTKVTPKELAKEVKEHKETTEVPLIEETSTLKRRRSDEVQHWMNNTFNYFQQDKDEVLSIVEDAPILNGKLSYHNKVKGGKCNIVKESMTTSELKTDEEEEEISLAELMYKLNLTKEKTTPPIKNCSTFVAPAIPPYTHHHF